MLNLKSLPKVSVLLASLVALGALTVGCGTNTSASDTGQSTDRGRQLFVAKCGTCHTMAQAASSGAQGPDLDDAFMAARKAGMDDDTVKSIVRAQVQRPYPSEPNFPGRSMPADIATGNDLEDIAAYVAKYAGVPGAEPPQAAGGGGPGAQVFSDNGCGSCHTLAAASASGTLGPSLDENIPKLSKKEIGDAILDPTTIKLTGYPKGVMPAFEGKLSDQQLNDLVEFLMTSADGK